MRGLRAQLGCLTAVLLLLACVALFFLHAQQQPQPAAVRIARRELHDPEPASANAVPAAVRRPKVRPGFYTPPVLHALASATELRAPTQIAGMGVTHRERLRGEVHLNADWHRGSSAPVYLPELKTLLCTHAKAGCTTLRSYVLMWSGDLEAPDGRAHKMLFRYGTYNRTFIEVVRDHKRASKLFADPDVLRVVFVREPIARVISMFINKIIRNNDEELRARGVKTGPNRKAPLFKRADLQLPDYGIHKFIQGLWKWRFHLQDCTYHDEHLTLQSCRCGHRFVDYDFVGRTERLDDDVEEWLRLRGRPDLVPKKQPMNKSNETLTQTLLKALTEEDIQRLWEIYEEDYARFGYPDPRRNPTSAATVKSSW
jgi:hypothetical protein